MNSSIFLLIVAPCFSHCALNSRTTCSLTVISILFLYVNFDIFFVLSNSSSAENISGYFCIPRIAYSANDCIGNHPLYC